MQKQLEIKPWNLRPVVLLIIVDSPQSEKTQQVKIK